MLLLLFRLMTGEAASQGRPPLPALHSCTAASGAGGMGDTVARRQASTLAAVEAWQASEVAGNPTHATGLQPGPFDLCAAACASRMRCKQAASR